MPPGDATALRRRVPYTVDIGFTIIGVADHTTELNLMAATEIFFHLNKFLEMDREPENPLTGYVRYEMDFTPDGDLRVSRRPVARTRRADGLDARPVRMRTDVGHAVELGLVVGGSIAIPHRRRAGSPSAT